MRPGLKPRALPPVGHWHSRGTRSAKLEAGDAAYTAVAQPPNERQRSGSRRPKKWRESREMPAPPPPPPPAPPPPAYSNPPPPPPPAFSQGRAGPGKPTGGTGGRSALLADIHKGARLKKVAQVNDRSAPQIENSKTNNNSGNGRAAVPPSAGGLFASGFPVLKPPGQRDSPGNKSAMPLPGMKNSAPKQQDQESNMKLAAPPNLPKLPASAPPTIAIRAPPPRPIIFGSSPPPPPPIPPASNKPQLVSQMPPPAPPFKDRPAKTSDPPPLPSFQPQGDKPPRSPRPSRSPRPPSLTFPPPPPPQPPLHRPPAPPSGYSVGTEEFTGLPPPPPDLCEYVEVLPSRCQGTDYELPDSFPPPPDIKEYPSFPPPPPPPLTQSARRRLSEPPPFNPDQSNNPSRPTKVPGVKHSVPPQPTPARMHKASSGGKIIPPPPPPARSPYTELSSRQQPAQHSSNRTSALSLDDFESKFTFHSVDELPPPEAFEPLERVYPSKCPSGNSVRHFMVWKDSPALSGVTLEPGMSEWL
ncbi:WAS/WASL-interacting protein family member 3 [Pelodytes ibericus]